MAGNLPSKVKVEPADPQHSKTAETAESNKGESSKTLECLKNEPKKVLRNIGEATTTLKLPMKLRMQLTLTAGAP